MMRPRKVFTVLSDQALVYYSVYGEGKFYSVDLGLNANQVLAVNSDLPLFCELFIVTVIWLTQSL